MYLNIYKFMYKNKNKEEEVSVGCIVYFNYFMKVECKVLK